MPMPRKTKSKYTVPELGRSTNRRPARVADTMRAELAMLLLQGVRDQRLTGVTVTTVEVTPDMRTAFISFSCPAGAELKTVEAGLASSRGFMRSYLAKILNLRYMPELLFRHDLSAVRQAEMERILREIANEPKSSERDSQDNTEG